MATVSGIKINESFDQNCGVFGSSETIETLKQKVVKSGMSIVFIDDNTYNIHGHACVTATVLSNTSKFIQVASYYRYITMSLSNTIWTIGTYTSDDGSVNPVHGPHETSLEGLQWVATGAHVVNVGGRVQHQTQTIEVTGLPKPALPNLEIQSYYMVSGSSAQQSAWLRYSSETHKFTFASFVHYSSTDIDIYGTYVTSEDV